VSLKTEVRRTLLSLNFFKCDHEVCIHGNHIYGATIMLLIVEHI